MANQVKGEFRARFGGQDYTLVWDFNAIAEMDDRIDWSIADLQTRIDAHQLKVKDIRLMVWSALLRHHPGLSVEDVGRLLDVLEHPTAIADLMSAILHGALPEPSKEPGSANPPDAQAGTGASSISEPVGTV